MCRVAAFGIYIPQISFEKTVIIQAICTSVPSYFQNKYM